MAFSPTFAARKRNAAAPGSSPPHSIRQPGCSGCKKKGAAAGTPAAAVAAPAAVFLFVPPPLPTCRGEYPKAEQGMKGRRPTPGNRKAQGQRSAVQASVARRRRSSATQPPEPLMPNAAMLPVLDAPATTVIKNQEQPPQPVLWSEVVPETSSAYRSARHMSLYEPPAQPLTLLSAGVLGTPTTVSTLTEPAAGQFRLSTGVEDAPAVAGGESPPNLPPSNGDTAGASSPDPSATFVGGVVAFHAEAKVVSPPEPVAGIPAASVGPLGLSRIETDYPNLLFLAISLEKMARDEIARLSNERPNDPYTIESNKKQSDLLSIFADVFAKIAAALEEYSKDPRPFLAGKAKEIRDWVGAQLKAWWEANEAEARDLCVRLPIFIASIGALNLAGADMHFATAAIGASVGGKNAIAAIKAAWKRHAP
jgi:hypothetical protein